MQLTLTQARCELALACNSHPPLHKRSFIRRAFLTFLLAICGLPWSASAIYYTNFFVNQNAPASSRNNGTSWANAFTNLQDAINAVNPTPETNVELWIATGTYYPGTNQTASFHLKSFLILEGGFAGNESTDANLSPFLNPTVLSGDIGRPMANHLDANNIVLASVPFNPNDPGAQDNCYNVVTANNVVGAVMADLYITGGYANASSSVVSQETLEGMSIPVGPLTQDTNFVATSVAPLDSRVAGGGLFFTEPAGAIQYGYGFALALNDCVFENNGARGYGGAVACTWAGILTGGVIFQNNYAGEEGGAYWGLNSESDFESCDFETNTCAGAGGALVYRSLPTPYTVNLTNIFSPYQQEFSELMIGAAETSAKLVPKLYQPNLPVGGLVTQLQKLGGEGYGGVSSHDRLASGMSFLRATIAGGSFAQNLLNDVNSALAYNQAGSQNWSNAIYNYAADALPSGWLPGLDYLAQPDPGESLTGLVQDTKNWEQENLYNLAGESILTDCQFDGNVAGTEGGAYYCAYDNVHVEVCTFTGNSAADGGAVANFVWNTPVFISCSFLQNHASSGFSAMVNAFHARPTIMNCTFSDNSSSQDAEAVGNVMGADTTICNTILWGNTNGFGATGADVYAAVHADLDPASLNNYNSDVNGGAELDWTSICDLSWSCMQSLESVPLGNDEFQLNLIPSSASGSSVSDIIFGVDLELGQIAAGFSATGEEPTGLNPARGYNIDDLDEEGAANMTIAEFNQLLAQADIEGLLDAEDYVNAGEGMRPNILNPAKANINIDPQLINGTTPSHISPVLRAGNPTRLNNGFINSIDGVRALDVQLNPRYSGESIDMGAVEYQGGPDPVQQPTLPAPDVPVVRTILYVTPTGAGTQDGTSWQNATANLFGAMQTPNATVWVATGTYVPSSIGDVTQSFSLGQNVQVYGGFSGFETNLDQRNLLQNPTTLSGNTIGGPSHHVMVNQDIDYQSVLDNFIITGGSAADFGGGIKNINASPTIQYCTFTGNFAPKGGAIYSTGTQGSPLYFCAFTNNTAVSGGGAIYASNSMMQVENCIFSGNSSSNGGAISLSGSELTSVYNSLFVNNAAPYNSTGGAIASFASDLEIYNSTFTLNTSEGGGGALSFSGTGYSQPLTIENSIFWNNTSSGAATQESEQITVGTGAVKLISTTLIQGLYQLAGPVSSGNINADPAFVDPGAGDFELTTNSPCATSGNPDPDSTLVPLDLAGLPRVINGSMSLGCYQFEGTPPFSLIRLTATRTCTGSGPSYALAASSFFSGKVTNQWQVSFNGQTFVNLTNDSQYSGVNTLNLSIAPSQMGLNGYAFRLVQSSLLGGVASTIYTVHESPPLIYVNTAATGANTGLDWADAFTTLQAALDLAQPCSQIWVAQGTYFPSLTGNTNDSFRLRSDIAIYGGFRGTETALGQRNWLKYPTVLSGALNGVNNLVRSQNIFLDDASVLGQDCDPTAILDGFTLCNAANDAMVNLNGASPTINHCVFTNNAGIQGGAMWNSSNAAPAVADCIFIDNSASVGGAVYCDNQANSSFFDCLFVGNDATAAGGAVAVNSSVTALINCTIADNNSSVAGGGLYIVNSTNNLFNSIIWNNTDGETSPTATSPQIYLDLGNPKFPSLLLMSNCCLEGLTNLVNSNFAYDPIFANESLGNYTLSAYSPAIGAGNDLLTAGFYPPYDLNGNFQFAGRPIDLGPYQYQGTPATPLTLSAVPQPPAGCNASGITQYSITGPASLIAGTVWEVNKNNGQGFLPVVTNSFTSILQSPGTSTLLLETPPESVNGWKFEATLPSIGFASAPVIFSPQSAPIIYVNAASPGGTGSAWTNALNDLQAALLLAQPCSQIWVAQGTYVPGLNPVNPRYFTLVPQVGVFGGFAGNETNFSQRNWTNHPTYLSGGDDLDPLIANRVTSPPIDITAVLDGFFITATNGSTAIENYVASPTLRNCVFTGNTNSCFYNLQSGATIANCIFSNNADSCIYNQQAQPVISGCLFVNNTTPQSGAAIDNLQANPSIEDSQFISNSAGSGGAIYNDSQSAPIIDRCAFFANSSGSGGAIGDAPTAGPSIRNSLFTGNQCIFRGGAVADYGSNMSVINCTFVANNGNYSGGGLYFQGVTGSVVNSIFWDNTVTENIENNSVELLQVHNQSGGLAVSNSIIQGLHVFAGHNNLPYDPLFSNPAGGNFQLSQFSPAINTGLASVLAGEPTDLAGQPRLASGADLGAYEFQGTPAAPVDLVAMPQSETNCANAAAQFTLITRSNDNDIFTWQVFNGTNFVPVASNTAPYQIAQSQNTNVLTVFPLSLGLSGTQFRLIDNTGFVSPEFDLSVTPPGIIYVNGALTNHGNGASWAQAFTNLQDAFAQAGSCDQIWVAAGTYTATVLTGRIINESPVQYSFPLIEGLGLYGGFSGTETNLSQRNWTSNATILRGMTNQPVFNNNGAYDVIDQTTIVDGFTIDGRNLNYSPGAVNPAVNNSAAGPTFRNCAFINGSPAMMNTQGATPLIANCVFSNNLNFAIFNNVASPVVSNCLFISNSTADGSGGAIENFSASPIIVDSQFLTNSAGANGGALDFEGGSSPVIRACVFEGNSSGDGGAILSENSSVYMADCLFAGNISSFEGGGLFFYESTNILNNCTLAENAASFLGGGVYSLQSTFNAVNTIFWDNQSGGDASVEAAQLNVDSGAYPANSIIQGLSQYAGSGNLSYNPLFVGESAGDFSPGLQSPAIKAGTTSVVQAGDTDVYGYPRIVQSNVDIGAIEVQNPGAGAPLDVSVFPQPQTSCVGGAALFSLTGGAGLISQVNWQINDGGGFSNVPNDGLHFILTSSGATILAISNVTPSLSNETIRFVVTNPAYTSAPLGLTVLPRRIIYVNGSATGNGSGVDWANACNTLLPAVAEGDSCSEIWVAGGIYAPIPNQPLSLKSGLQIYGGFAGTETNLSQRNWTNNPTFLYSTSNTYSIFNDGYNETIDNSALLDGFVLTSAGGGNGVYNLQASPTFQNCVFASSASTGLASQGNSSPVINNCVFTNNSGNAFYCTGGTPLLTNCVFAGNTSQVGGAAIYADGGATPWIVNCHFVSNSTTASGGAIFNNGTTVTIINCIFDGNTASSSEGGALFASGTTDVTNSLFFANSAGEGGAAAVLNGAYLNLVNCTVTGNSAASAGGGLELAGGFSTFLLNSIFWQNSVGNNSGETAQIDNGDVATTGIKPRNCCIEGLSAFAGFNNIGNDPLFLDPVSGNYQLNSNSPAINIGNNSYNSQAADLAGAPRIQLGTVDLGAYESAAAAPSPVVLLTSLQSTPLCLGNSEQFAVQAASGESFAWQYLSNGSWAAFTLNGSNALGPGLGSYAISSDATASTLFVSGITAAMDGYQFRFVIPGLYTSAPVQIELGNTVIYVNAAGRNGGDGTSWSRAFNDLQDALASVEGCRDEIWLARGTYRPTSGTNIDANFFVPEGTIIYGGFAGNETNLSQRNWVSNTTILSGDLGGGGLAQTKSVSVVYYNNVDASTILDGVTVTGAEAGIACEPGAPLIRNCTLTSNWTGIIVYNSSPLIQNCLFVSNSSPSFGAGMFVSANGEPGNPVMQNCVFVGNSAAQSGGAVYVESASPTFEGCLMADNYAGTGGGALSADIGIIKLVNCTIAQNSTAFSSGGGIYVGPSEVILNNSVLWNNTSTGNDVEASQLGGPNIAEVAVTNTCIQNLGDDTYDVPGPGGTAFSTLTNNANVPYDPLFVDGAAGDFHLQPCSPLIAAGVTNFAADLTTDLDGNPRLVNGHIDFGAYEQQSPGGTSLFITIQPASFQYCPASVNTLMVQASGETSFQWQANTNGAGFVNISDGALFSGSATAALTLASLPYSSVPWQFRCVLQGGGCSVTSDVATVAVQPTLFVNAAAAPAGDGLSWATAFQTIDQAVASPFSQGCDQVWVATGTYAPTNLFLHSGLQLFGGFAGHETSLSQRNWTNNITLLTGTNGPVIQNSEPCDNTALLDGFVVSARSYPATISLNDASPVLRNCLFASNQNDVIQSLGSLLVTNCVFAGNAQVSVFNYGSNITIAGCSFESNQNYSVQNEPSAGLGTLVINDSIFQDNAYEAVNNSSVLLVTNCLFAGNVGNDGAAVANNGTLAMVNCTLVNNSAIYQGGGVDNLGGTALLVNSIFWNNQAPTPVEIAQIFSTTNLSDFSTNGLSISNCLIQGLSIFAGNSNVGFDPLFVDANTGAFELSPYSSAIGAGNIAFINGASLDLAGNPRVVNGSVDLGAYETGTAQGNVQLSSVPASQSSCSGGDANFTVTSPTAASFSWQYFDGATWQNFAPNGPFWTGPALGIYTISSNSTSSTLTVSGIVSGVDGYQFRFLLGGSGYIGAPLVLSYTPSAIVYVDAMAARGGDGTSWATAYNNLADALNAGSVTPCANVIWMAQGTYSSPSVFQPAPGTSIYGGFVSGQNFLSQRDPAHHPTILTSELNINKFSFQPINTQAVIDGLILDSGGLVVSGASPIITNCVIRNASANGANISQGAPAFFNCAFINNNAGGVICFSGQASFVSCLFSNNSFNGGLDAYTCDVTLTNCVLSGNSGAITLSNAGLTAVNCTIADNGSGVYGIDVTNIVMANSILWNNGGSSETAQVNLPADSVSISYSDIEGLSSYTGHGNIGLNPVFPAPGQYDLVSCSPAVDAGNNAGAGSITTDFAGNPRIVNTNVDMGAYEYQGVSGPALDVVSQPAPLSYCPADSNSFTFAVTGQGLSYQWEVNRNDGLGYIALVENANYIGTVSPTLVLSNLASADNGASFECMVTTAAGCTVVSDPAALNFISYGRYYVNQAAPPGGDGLSWSNAFQTLDQALASPPSSCNTEIWVAQGTYNPPLYIVNGTDHQLYNNLALYGGFVGTETNLNQRNWTNNPTIIDGQNFHDYIIYNQQYYNGSAFVNVDASARLDGFILQNAVHAAVLNYQGQAPTIANCLFRLNSGTAISNIASGPTIAGCTFISNGSAGTDDGGAIYCDVVTNMVIENSFFASNSTGFGGEGGAIYCGSATNLVIENSVFQANVSDDFGGAVYVGAGNLTLANSLFSGNASTAFSGGAVFASNIICENCTFAGNSAFESGGGLVADYGLVANCIFWSNYDNGFTNGQTAQLIVSAVVSNCIIQNIITNPLDIHYEAQLQGNQNSSVDPQFIQNIDGSLSPQAGGNFHFGLCAPPVDAGSNAFAPLPFDLDGNPRISGKSVDIGCYEYQQPPFVAQPSNEMVSVLNAASFTAISASNNAVYQWQMRSSSNGVFANITDTNNFTGITGTNLRETNLTLADNGAQFRCTALVDGCLTVYSGVATLIMTDAPPVAYNVSVTNPTIINLFPSTSDPQGLPISYYTNVTQPAHGFLIWSGSEVEYNSFTNYFSGTDSFQYAVNNGALWSEPATVTITILLQHPAPIVTNQNISVPENTPTPFVLNGYDLAGNPIAYSIVTSPSHGALSGTPPNLIYTPATYYHGLDSFVFQEADGSNAQQATAHVTVSHVPQNPVTVPDSAVVYLRGRVTVPVLQNDFDPDSNSMSITAVGPAAYGYVNFTASNVTYVQNGILATNDSFTYQVTDSQGGTNTGTVSINILTNYSYIVTTNADSGPGTLRDAIVIADTISSQPFLVTFSPSLAGQTIPLQTVGDNAFGASALALSNNVIIDGSGAPGLVIARNATAAAMRLFRVDPASQATINDLILSNGLAVGGPGGTNSGGGGGGGGGFGGAIYTQGALSLSNVYLTANLAQGGLGGAGEGTLPTIGGIGGGVNGGAAGAGAGGFGGGGGGASDDSLGLGGLAGFGGGSGGGLTGHAGVLGGTGGFGGGGGGCGSTFSGGGGLGAGGGIFNNGGNLAATNCTFAGNLSIGGTGGVANESIEQGGNGQGFGGGAFNYNGSAAFVGCNFTNNSASNADAIFNVGDSSNASVTILNSAFVSLTAATNFVQTNINGGTANGLRDNVSQFTQTAPALANIPNQVNIGETNFNIGVTATNPTFSVSSGNELLFPDNGLLISGPPTNAILEVTAALGPVGAAQLTVTVAQGGLSMSELFGATVSHSLTAEVTPHQGTILPVLLPGGTWSISGITQPSNGVAGFNTTNLSYTNNGTIGTDFFAFQFTDGTNTAFASVTVSVVTNVVPVAAGESYTTEENTPVSIVLSGSDSLDDPIVSYTVASAPSHGSLSGTGPDLIYHPAANFSGPDAFTYYVNNGLHNSTNATVTILVRGTNSVTVANPNDSGPGSLRAAIAQADAGPSDSWIIHLNGQSLVLTNAGDTNLGPTALLISNNVIIDGQGAIITGDNLRLFRVASNASLVLENLTLQMGLAQGEVGGNGGGGGGGGAGLGGAIFNDGILLLTNCTLAMNQAVGGNGGTVALGGPPISELPGGAGGGPFGGSSQFGPGSPGGFASGGSSGSYTTGGSGSGGSGGFGGGNGWSPLPANSFSGGNGGFGGGGGSGYDGAGGGGAAFGGAIFNRAGTAVILQCTFATNSVTGGTGGSFSIIHAGSLGVELFNYNGQVLFSNCDFLGGAFVQFSGSFLNSFTYAYGTATNTIDLPNVATFGQTNVDFNVPPGSAINAVSDNTNFTLTVDSNNDILGITLPFAPVSANITLTASNGPSVYVYNVHATTSFDFAAQVYTDETTNFVIFGPDSLDAVIAVTPAAQGTVSFQGGRLSYTATNPAATADSFTYLVSDGTQSATGHVTLSIVNSIINVTSTADAGAGSLRAAIDAANADPDTPWLIALSPSLAGQTIRLATVGDSNFDASALGCHGNIIIDGSDAPGLILAPAPNSPPMRLAYVDGSLTINNLTVSGWTAEGDGGGAGSGGGGGGGGFGGAIFISEGYLSASGVTFSNNQAMGGAGGSFSNSATGGNGGGINGGNGASSGGNGGYAQFIGGGGGGAGATNAAGTGGLGFFGGGNGGGNGTTDTGGGGYLSGGGGGNDGGGGGGLGAGGAIFNENGAVIVNECLFISNTVSGGAGGTGQSISLNGSPGSGYGAAIFNYTGDASITNSVFSNNAAAWGDDLFSLGDGDISSVSLSGIIMDSSSIVTNFVSAIIDGGNAEEFVGGTNQIGRQSPPWITAIANITTNGSFTVPVEVSPPSLGGFYSVTATSSDTNVVPDINLLLTNTNTLLTVQPAVDGLTLVSVAVNDTGLSATASFLARFGASQGIIFNPLPDVHLGSAPFVLSATSSSGLPVFFAVVSGPAVISGSTVTVTNTGLVTIAALQSGDGDYLAAASVDQSFNVLPPLIGSLQVTILPAAAVTAGAEWQVDGGTPQASGVTVTNLPVGSHTVSFLPAVGFVAPAAENVVIAGGETTVTNGTYALPPGSVRVLLSPTAIIADGGEWQIDGGPFQPSGALVTNLAVGSHTLAFAAISGWITPSNQIIDIFSQSLTIADGLYIPSSPPASGLILLTNGAGVIQHAAFPPKLLISNKYTVRAMPLAGNLFENWTGGTNPPYEVVSTNANYPFVMQSNLVLEANFVTNLFLAAEGAYAGLFAPTNTPRTQANSGAFNFTLTTTGSFTGKLEVGGQSAALSGKFNADGTATVTSSPHSLGPVTTSMQLDPPDQAVIGTVSNNNFVADLTGYQNVFGTRNKATAYEGQYTLVIPGTTNPAAGPSGNGYGSVTVKPTGAVTFSGSLADGTTVSQSGIVSSGGFWPLYISLYNGSGSVWAWNLFTNGTLSTNLAVSWINGGNSVKTAALRSGFTNEAATLIGSAYNPAAVPLTGFTSADVILAGGGLLRTITNGITISSHDIIALTNALLESNKLRLTITKATGIISGTLANPTNQHLTIKINGIILQDNTNAAGYFLENGQSGAFSITPH